MVKNSRFFSIFVIVTSFIVIPHFSQADTLGQKVTFYVDSSFDKYSRSQVSATLRHVSDRLYFYVDDSYWNTLDTAHQDSFTNNMVSLGNEFDDNIYLKETQFWGAESNPGIDGDSRITILLEQLVAGNGGYFNTGNGYTKDEVADSNVRDMIYLNTEVVNSTSDFTRTFLAHEFQHLISFNQKELLKNSSEDTWLNESRSEYAVSVAGYNDTYYKSPLSRRVTSFLENPSNSLTEWPNENVDYSIASVFAEYLSEQYGGNILSDTLKTSASGINSINNFLQGKGYYEKFSDVFMRWMAAVYLNDTGLDSHYGYTRPELKSIKVKPQHSVYLAGNLSEYVSSHLIKNWQPVWLDYNLDTYSASPAKSVKIDISGQSDQNFLVSYITFFNDGRTKVERLPVIAGRGVAYISNLNSGVKRVTVLATNGTKSSQFYTKEAQYSLSVKVSLVDTEVVEEALLKDGALIKKANEPEIYVIWGKYRRYLLPGVIALYGHLDPANAIEVSPEVFNTYTTTNYVKYINEEKVYALWPDGTKHWLNITPQQWDASYRDWNAIFVISDLELDYYKTGAEITR